MPDFTIGARNVGIDCLRGFSLFLVFMLHYTLILPRDFWPLSAEGGLNLFQNGYYGVTIFFVISGYLITSNSLSRYGRLCDISISQFYVMRASRILPLLLSLMSILSIFAILDVRGFQAQENHPIWEMWLYVATFRFNIYCIYHMDGKFLSGQYCGLCRSRKCSI